MSSLYAQLGTLGVLILYILYKEGLTRFLAHRGNGNGSTVSSSSSSPSSTPFAETHTYRYWKLEMADSIGEAFSKTIGPTITAQTRSIDRQTDVLAEILAELKSKARI